MLIKRGGRLLDALVMKRGRVRRSLRLWLLVAIAVLLGLAGTVWLLLDGTRGANIANLLGLWVGVLGLLVPLWTAHRGKSPAESSPDADSAPGQQSGTAIGRTGGIVVGIPLSTRLSSRFCW